MEKLFSYVCVCVTLLCQRWRPLLVQVAVAVDLAALVGAHGEGPWTGASNHTIFIQQTLTSGLLLYSLNVKWLNKETWSKDITGRTGRKIRGGRRKHKKEKTKF